MVQVRLTTLKEILEKMTISINATVILAQRQKHYKENNAQNPKDNFQFPKPNIALIKSIAPKCKNKPSTKPITGSLVTKSYHLGTYQAAAEAASYLCTKSYFIPFVRQV